MKITLVCFEAGNSFEEDITAWIGSNTLPSAGDVIAYTDGEDYYVINRQYDLLNNAIEIWVSVNANL